MQAVCFQSVGEVACIDLPDPDIVDAHDAIIRVSLAGLCGSDLHAFFGRETGLDVNTVMGHELVGTVAAVGDAVTKFQTGDRVFAPFTTNCGQCFYCQRGLTARCELGELFGWRENGAGLHGCQSEYVRVPLADGTLKHVPDSVSDRSALLLGDNFSTGWFCAEMAGVSPEGTYAIIGCGTVGLMCLHAAKHRGAENIFAIDPVAARRKEAEALGAIPLEPGPAAVAAVQQATSGRGADAVMELVGLPDAQELAMQLIRPGGTLSVIGCHCTPNFAFGPSDAYDKNLTYRTGRCSARHYMDQLIGLIEDGTFELDDYISREFTAEECVNAYDVFSNRRDGCLKAAIRFG